MNKLIFTTVFCFFGAVAFAQENDAKRDEIYNGNIDLLIEKMVEKKIAYNHKIKVGYRIQIYNGDEITAQKIVQKLLEKHSEKGILLLYKEPDWKVQTKIYHDKLSAKKALKSIQKQFPNARIF